MRTRSRKTLVALAAGAILVTAGLAASLLGSDTLADVLQFLLLGFVVLLVLEAREQARAARAEAKTLSTQVRVDLRRLRRAARDARTANAHVRRTKARVLRLSRLVASAEKARGDREQSILEASVKVLAAVEKERALASQRHSDLLQKPGVKGVVTKPTSELGEIAALIQYQSQITPRALLPTTGGYAMTARSLGHLVDLVERFSPRTVVELGSGTSSIWLGYLLESNPKARVVSIDHLPEYAEQTRAAVHRHGLESTVEVRLAPLVAYPVEVSETPWYDSSAFDDVTEGIDLLLVDGPPRSVGPLSRLSAMTVLNDKLADGALIVLDDADRPDESEVIRRWIKGFDLERIDGGVSRLAVLRKRRSAD